MWGKRLKKGIRLKQHSRKIDNAYIVLYALRIIKKNGISTALFNNKSIHMYQQIIGHNFDKMGR